MLRYRGHIETWLAAGLFIVVPTLVLAQSPQQQPVPLVPQRQLQPVSEWSKQLLDMINTCWTESNTVQRERSLLELVEQTPAQLAYVTRIFQQNDALQTAKTIATLKDCFGIIRRVGWQPADLTQMQRIVATWSVVAPQLVKAIPSPDLSANQRRYLEQALVDLAYISRDAQLGTPVARQTWQAQVLSLGQMTRHAKLSVRLVALSVLEAIGSDAAPANLKVQQCLSDGDRFVRWSAIRTLQAMGVDQASLQAIAKLQKDEDPQVREAATLACAALPVSTVAATDAKRLPAALVSATPLPPIHMTLPNEVAPVTLPKVQPTIATSVPSKLVERQSTAPALNLEMPALPVNMLPSQPAVLPAAMPSLPMQEAPETKGTPAAEPVPLFAPPAMSSSAKAKSIIQPVAVQVPAPTQVNPVHLWLPRLRQGTLEQQVQAVRELGKLGPTAADAVPTLAELLLKGDVVIRREVSITLAKIGAPAKMATAVLERCLQDADTDVKVNAARALLELADK